jgi:predicted nucleic acid-binding protein
VELVVNSDVPQYYWDTCIFVAHINEDRSAYGGHIDDIRQFVDEAKEGKCKIHYSPITIAEFDRQKIKTAQYGTFSDFLRDFKGAFMPVAPDPNVMAVAAELRSLEYRKNTGKRYMHTPDAIHLASALALTEAYGLAKLEAFHTFDNGSNSNGVPLLSYPEWCETCSNDPLAQKIINMNRSKPLHPEKKLPGT